MPALEIRSGTLQNPRGQAAIQVILSPQPRRLPSVENRSDNSASEIIEARSSGALEQLQRGNIRYVNTDYLVTGEVSKIRENNASTGVGVLATYAYDDLGQRTSLTFGNGVVQNYGFDAVSRLASLSNDVAGTASDQSTTFTNSARCRSNLQRAPATPTPGEVRPRSTEITFPTASINIRARGRRPSVTTRAAI